MSIATFLLAISLFPMHGVVLQSLPNDMAIVRNFEVPGMLAPSTRRYRLSPDLGVRAAVGIDGIVDRSTQPWTLRDATIAGPFAPGIPDTGRVLPLDLGSTLPAVDFVDQEGRIVRLDRAFRGKTVMLSFIFTRCPDLTLCPAISGKFAYLQAHLDPAKFALVEITLDPPYDSPEILRQYGSAYGADPKIWHLLTGEGATVQHLFDRFGIDSLRVSASNFIHNDKLVLVTPAGRIAYIIETAGWEPDGVLAEAHNIAGMASNPFARLKLSLIASLVALCGGSQYAGVVLLEMSLFLVIVVVVIVALWMVARVLVKNH